MRRLSLLCWLIASPLIAGVWGARGVSHAFLVRGGLVYDVDGRGVAVYDAGNPAAIRRVAVIDSAAESLDGAFLGNDLLVLTRAGIDRYDGGNLALRAQIQGRGFEHLRANAEWIVAASASGARVWANDLTEVRRIAFTNHVNAIALKGDALYVALDQAGIAAVDLTTGNQTVLAENAKDLAVAGDTLYVAGGVNGLLAADVADPFAPRVIRREGAGEMNLARVAAAGTKIFASESPSTIRIFDGAGEV